MEAKRARQKEEGDTVLQLKDERCSTINPDEPRCRSDKKGIRLSFLFTDFVFEISPFHFRR